MKRLLFITVICAFVATPAMADLYTVDLGLPDVQSHPGIILNGWGEPEPVPTSHGNYGGFGGGLDYHVPPTTATLDHLCRMVWGNAEPGGTLRNLGDWAEITYPVPILSATIRHLEGITIDSFDVHVDNVFWGHFENGSYVKSFGEQWFETVFTGTPGSTLRITVTAGEWAHRTGWGQLGIDRVEAVPVPVPGAVLLGILGLSVVGVKLRKFA